MVWEELGVSYLQNCAGADSRRSRGDTRNESRMKIMTNGGIQVDASRENDKKWYIEGQRRGEKDLESGREDK